MGLFGALLTALIMSLAGLRGPTIRALLVAVPAWFVALGAGHWLEHDDTSRSSNATWLQLGRNVLEPGVLVLVLAILASWWWTRSGSARAGRIVVGALRALPCAAHRRLARHVGEVGNLIPHRRVHKRFTFGLRYFLADGE